MLVLLAGTNGWLEAPPMLPKVGREDGAKGRSWDDDDEFGAGPKEPRDDCAAWPNVALGRGGCGLCMDRASWVEGGGGLAQGVFWDCDPAAAAD